MWPFREKRSSLENPAVSLTDPAAWAMIFGAGGTSATGITVTADMALGVPAVWAAVNFLSDTIASLPLQLFKEAEKGRQTATKDPLYSILHDAPNPQWTSARWRKYSMQNTLLNGGRSYTYIERNRAGRVMNLWPLNPTRTTPRVRNGEIEYALKGQNGHETVYAFDEIIDIPFMLRVDGVSHIDPVDKLKDTIGLAIAMRNYASRFFQNGGVPPLALTGPINSVAGAKRAGNDITEALLAERDDKKNILVMPQGHELKPIGMEPEKGQLVEAQRAQVVEIARFYGLPPVFLQDLTNGTFSNTEQQDLNFVKHTLCHWLEAIEQEINLKVFSARNTTSFVEFNVDGLLRGDFKTRMDGYATAIQNAVYKPDECRRFENMPAEGGDADKLHIQGATVPLGEQSKAQPKTPQGAAAPDPKDSANEQP
jgi:HK97 family phage portal protein